VKESWGFNISGWTFTLNPDVLPSIYQNGDRLVRHIFVIETLKSKIYFAVRDFLAKHIVNVNSYFTGGSADFICDVYFRGNELNRFKEELQDVLVKEGAGAYENVEKLVSIFRVDEPLMLCRKKVTEMGVTDSETIQFIKDDPAKFELAYRDYTSQEAIAAFGNPREIRDYLTKLEKGKAIIGYHVRVNDCHRVDLEYVPLCSGRALDKLVRERVAKPQPFLQPVVELLKVTPVQPTDEVERQVTHIFVNEYEYPGQRNEWRQKIYKSLGDEPNVFSYPIEGVVSQSPIVFSDLPETISESKKYSGKMHLGYLNHLSTKFSQRICIEPEFFANQGVTLGLPGTGKTNTDCVLIEEALIHLKRILIIDSEQSHSIRDKAASFPEELKSRINYVTIGTEDSVDKITSTIKACAEGCHVIEANADKLAQLFNICLGEIEGSEGNQGNANRVVTNLLLVEEANDAFGKNGERRRIISRLEDTLNKAYRKGWCIWISTQHPAHLGYDDASAKRIFDLLQTRIIHQLEVADISLLKDFLKDTIKADSKRLNDKLDQLVELKKGVAFIHGSSRVDGQVTQLPPVIASIRLLGEGTSAP
jgi:hypothetical protein